VAENLPLPDCERDAELPKKRRWLKGCATAALCLLVLLAALAAGWALHIKGEQKRLALRVSELLAEVESASVVVKDEENAGLRYAKAMALAKDLGSTSEFWKQSQEEPDFDFRSSPVAEHLDKNQAYLSALVPITKLPNCSFKPNFAMGVAHLETPPRELAQSGMLLMLAAGNAASSGNPGRGLEFAHMGLRIAAHLGQDETLFCRMFQAHSEKTVARGLENVVNLSEPDAAAIADSLRQLAAYRSGRRDFSRTLGISRALTLRTLERILAGEESFADLSESENNDGSSMASAERILRWTGAGYRGARHLDKVFGQLVLEAKRPFPEFLDSMKAAAEEGRPRGKSLNILNGKLFAALSLSADWKVLETGMAHSSRLDAAFIGLGYRLYRLKFGAYPESLAELAAKLPEHFKELPADPFTGKPFLYRRTATGCLVWSVGAVRADDGGDSKRDIVFELKK
jgi:hypothetical protein